MEKNRDELLDRLYGLRAGLSVYSQEADSLCAIEENYRKQERFCIYNVPRLLRGQKPYTEWDMEFYEKEAHVLDDAAYYAWCLNESGSPVIKRTSKEFGFDWEKFNDEEGVYWNSTQTDEMEQKRRKKYHTIEKIYERWLISDEVESEILKNQTELKKQELEEKVKPFDTDKKFFRKSVVSTVLYALLAIAAIAVYFVYGAESQSALIKYGSMGLIGLFGIVFLSSFIKFLIRAIPYGKQKNEIQKLENAVKYPEKSATVSSVYDLCNRLKSLITQREAKTLPYVIKLDNFYRALKKEYTPDLDERNWKNLDLIIYALETGRADTLKEALKFVDGELRTRRIERAIDAATTQICDTIRSSIASLEATVQNCCNRISMQIEEIGGKILATNQQILTTQRELLSEQRFTNALLEKASVSSAQLMEDVNKIRSNSDYINMCLRCG